MKKDYSIEERMQYAENLSHELLTPLTIIRMKAELLMQSPNLNEEDLTNLDVIMKSVERMSRLNKALIILSKINNDIYIDREHVQLNELIADLLDNMEDLIRKNQLKIRFSKEDECQIQSNPSLIEILLSNLLKNAIYHNYEGGEIKIKITPSTLIIENSTKKQLTENIYSRFVGSGDDQSTFGLGLSIVKKICDHLHYKLDHQLENGHFTMTVTF